MSEHVDEKAERFELLWEGMTPKGYNRAKSLKFRQYMRQHVLQKFHKRKPTQFTSVQDNHYNHIRDIVRNPFLNDPNLFEKKGEDFRDYIYLNSKTYKSFLL